MRDVNGQTDRQTDTQEMPESLSSMLISNYIWN